MRIEIHARHLSIPGQLVTAAAARLESALDRFAAGIQEVTLRLADVNGPRGGTGIEALAVARLAGGGQMVVRGCYDTPGAAVNEVSHRLAEQVRRQHGRALRSRHGR